MAISDDWRALNRANWDERVPIHVNAPDTYRLDRLRAGTSTLDPVAAEILGPLGGQRVLHLQCHFGMDSLMIARQAAGVTGLDFSAPAIVTANSLAAGLGLADRARFVESDVYNARAAILEPESFDRVFVSWGALCWLPDLVEWARIIASFLKPGGYLALAEAHPAAYVFDDLTATPDGRPGWYMPYLAREPMAEDRDRDYADPSARLHNSRTVEFLHPISDILTALIEAGLRVTRFQEHETVTWQMFACLTKHGHGDYRWPDRPWLPLSYSLRAMKP